MSEVRIVEETLCEHGKMECWVQIPLNDNLDPPTRRCPGGSRRVLRETQPDWPAAKEAFRREFPCHCDPAFTDRGRHASDCVYDEADAVFEIVQDALAGRRIVEETE